MNLVQSSFDQNSRLPFIQTAGLNRLEWQLTRDTEDAISTNLQMPPNDLFGQMDMFSRQYKQRKEKAEKTLEEAFRNSVSEKLGVSADKLSQLLDEQQGSNAVLSHLSGLQLSHLRNMAHYKSTPRTGKRSIPHYKKAENLHFSPLATPGAAEDLEDKFEDKFEELAEAQSAAEDVEDVEDVEEFATPIHQSPAKKAEHYSTEKLRRIGAKYGVPLGVGRQGHATIEQIGDLYQSITGVKFKKKRDVNKQGYLNAVIASLMSAGYTP
jgi:hypothetical protein